MSADGYLPPGVEHSDPYFHEPDPGLCTHCGGDLDEDSECVKCGEPVTEPWTREDWEDAQADAAYDSR